MAESQSQTRYIQYGSGKFVILESKRAIGDYWGCTSRIRVQFEVFPAGQNWENLSIKKNDNLMDKNIIKYF